VHVGSFRMRAAGIVMGNGGRFLVVGFSGAIALTQHKVFDVSQLSVLGYVFIDVGAGIRKWQFYPHRRRCFYEYSYDMSYC